jgi:hypothetical protein
MKSTLLNSGTTLVIALIGAGWAYAFYKAIWLLVALPAVIAAVGQVLFSDGKRKVRSRPAGAVRLMEWGSLGPFWLAVVGAGGIILIAAKIAPSQNASPEVKGIITAASGATVAAVGSVLVGKSESPWVIWVDNRISGVFKSAYTKVFEPGSPPQQAVFSANCQGYEGWGREARDVRVAVIADALKTGAYQLAS